jgi:outer membrane receptor protein involved in Fe transport
LAVTYSQPQNFPYGNIAGFSADGTVPDANLKPEFVNTKEVGLEVGFLKNRINVEATYFNQNNTDQILFVSQSSYYWLCIWFSKRSRFQELWC